MKYRRQIIQFCSASILTIVTGCLAGGPEEPSTVESKTLPKDLICDENEPNIPPGEGGGGYCGTAPERAQTVIKYNIAQDVTPLDVESWGELDGTTYTWYSVEVDITKGNIRTALLFENTGLRAGSEYIQPSGITVPIAPNNNIGTDGSLSSFDDILLGNGGFGSTSDIYFAVESSREVTGWDVDGIFSQRDDICIY